MSWRNDALASALRAARALRVGMEAQASNHIIAVVDAFATAPDAVTAPLAALFGQITAAQARRDLLRVADLLEFELPRALEKVNA